MIDADDKIIIDKDDEFIFMYKLDNQLNNKNIKIIRTNKHNKILYDPYCCVDYVILYNNKIICYIELKTRKTTLKYYYSLLIGSSKLNNIDKLHYPTLIIWEDPDDIYFCEYHPELLKLPNKFINNSYCKSIPNKYFIKNTIISVINNYITNS